MSQFVKDCCCIEESYSVLDLLGIVRKDQHEVVTHFLKNPGIYEGMLNIFLDAVKGLNPSVIIVANAFVRKVLIANTSSQDLFSPSNKADANTKKLSKIAKNNLQAFYNRFSLKADHKNGGYTLTIDNGCAFHLYFSCMLSGGHAIDLGNRENLIWLVRNYLGGPKRP